MMCLQILIFGGSKTPNTGQLYNLLLQQSNDDRGRRSDST